MDLALDIIFKIAIQYTLSLFRAIICNRNRTRQLTRDAVSDDSPGNCDRLRTVDVISFDTYCRGIFVSIDFHDCEVHF